MSKGIAWWRDRAGWARATAAASAGALAMLAALAPAPLQAAGTARTALAPAPLQAAGETGTPGGSGGTCPTPNPPNELTLVAGTPQTALLGSAFATGLQVQLANGDGCPVTGAAGTAVTFSAPASGAGGVFSTSASNVAVVGADASGAAAAPPFTANTVAGSYTVTASSQYGSVWFSLTNTATGVPARIVALSPQRSSAWVTSGYAQRLRVEVLDAGGAPVAGATVTFTLGAAAASACGASGSAGAGAVFAGGSAEASASTGASGVASSPPLTANATAGSFTATASVSTGGGSEPEPGAPSAAASGATPVSFSLSNRAGSPAKLTAGVGSTQSTPAGARFPIRLAVTVTDAQGNPVPRAQVAFSAPRTGASGRFTVRSGDRRDGRAGAAGAAGGRDPGGAHASRRARARVSHPRAVTVRTNACGIAVAPPFTAGERQGGYVVRATAAHARPAAFALVNEVPGRLR
ncbi:MAG TPA: hypothetical protein VL979_12590 [Solirubrobacteraceae bacterium]|nr:hypothetical protein [Solirubrobacteraceae bacterium]